MANRRRLPSRSKEKAPAALARLRSEHPPRFSFLAFADPFELLVAVILSAQCTDAQVNRVTPALFRAYPTPAALARARRADVERLVYSTGFYRNKAKHIQGAARAIVEEHGGKVPDTMEGLLRLPGVARKTANVVLTNAFGKIEGVCVDTHVARVARRIGLTTAKDPAKVEEDLCRVYPREAWPDVTYLFIQHGRATCDARLPRCNDCPLLALCAAGPRLLRSGEAAGSSAGRDASRPTSRAPDTYI